MKTFVNILLILAMVWVITYTEGWWTLMGFLPFVLLLSSFGIDRKISVGKFKIKLPIESTEEDVPGQFTYIVCDSAGEEHRVNCMCPVQCVGDWVHFMDEIKESAFYVPREAFFRARRFELERSIPVDNANMKMN